MPDPKPIYKDRDLYVPAFEVKIRGNDIPRESLSDIVSVSYSDGVDAIDTFNLTVNNWDAKAWDFKYTGSTRPEGKENPRTKLFDPGQTIELRMGYRTPTSSDDQDAPAMRLMLAGIITSLQPNFPASGQPTLTISGQNVLRKLMTKQETHHYPDKGKTITPSDIAKKVAQRGNLKIDNLEVKLKTSGSDEPQLEHVLQDNQYDVLFLLTLAHSVGYDLVLKDPSQKGDKPELHFGPSTKDRGSYQLKWGESLIHFAPKLSTYKQVHKLTVRGWDAIKKDKIEVTVTRDDLASRPLKDSAQRKRIEEGFRERHEVVVDRPFRSAPAARKYALGMLQNLAHDMVTGRGSTIGTPGLRAGSVIQLDGLGATFSGRYFVKSTTHVINSGGYSTEFDARMEEPQSSGGGNG